MRREGSRGDRPPRMAVVFRKSEANDIQSTQDDICCSSVWVFLSYADDMKLSIPPETTLHEELSG